jgi:hypothetical protein
MLRIRMVVWRESSEDGVGGPEDFEVAMGLVEVGRAIRLDSSWDLWVWEDMTSKR